MRNVQANVLPPLRSRYAQFTQIWKRNLHLQHGAFFKLPSLLWVVAPRIFSNNAHGQARHQLGLPNHVALRQHAGGLLGGIAVGF